MCTRTRERGCKTSGGAVWWGLTGNQRQSLRKRARAATREISVSSVVAAKGRETASIITSSVVEHRGVHMVEVQQLRGPLEGEPDCNPYPTTTNPSPLIASFASFRLSSERCRSRFNRKLKGDGKDRANI